MTSSRPYLLRALWEWIVDNGMTPHILVDASVLGVQVPREFVQEGRITLNLSNSAVQNLVLGNDDILFSARFSGKPMSVVVPIRSVLAVFSRETGQGMMFGSEPGGMLESDPESGSISESEQGRYPRARVKNETGAGKADDKGGGQDPGRDPGSPSSKGGKRRSGLRVVK